jgi:TonB-linked SusC/RagA family outer membrane protein
MKRLYFLQKRHGFLAFLLFISAMASAQSISGKVTEANGQPLPGVNVVEKGTTNGTSTAANGEFRLTTSGSSPVLIFSFVGYGSQEISVNNRSTLNVTMAPDDKLLNEVVVVGYGTQQKKDLTGSVVSIKGQELQQVPSPNAIQSLQGLVAGVDIAATSNRPGSSPSIRIRGNRSINASNEPLLVVDGLPFSGSLNDLNSSDIKSMEILKDASSTAIYGSRGANGVVLITTNRGTAGKIQVSYTGYYGIQKPLNKPDLMNGAEFAEFVRESQRNVGRYASDVPNAKLDETMFYFRNAGVEESVLQAYDASGNYDPSRVRSFDWLGESTRTGVQQDHQISVQSGSEKTQTSFSIGYFNNDGVVKGFGYERYNVRLSQDNQLTKWLKLGGTAAASINSNRTTTDLYGGVGQINPLAPIRDAEGVLIPEPASDPLTFNPLIVLEGRFSQANSKRFYASFFLEAQILDGLKYRLNYSPDYRTSRTGNFSDSRANNGNPSNASQSNNQQFHYVLDNLLIYEKILGSDHKLGATLLQSFERDKFETMGAAVNDLPYDSQLYYNLGTANLITSLTSNYSEWALNSYMARLNYGYKSRYLLTLTGRYDGSSRLAPGNKWSFFPSAALAWNASEEPFIQNLNTFTELKVRASYGMTGNTAINPYQTQGGLARTIYATDDAPAFGFEPSLITNPNLGWEKTRQANLGVDFGILKDRVTGTVDLYRQNTSDLLLARQLPTASGFTSIIENVGATRNQGVEVSLRGIVFDKPASNFRWTNQIIFTKNKEEILSLYNGKVDDVGNRWFIGSPVNTYFDYKKIGIFQSSEEDKALITEYNTNGGSFAPGEIKIQDTNADGRINAEDRVILGSTVPKWVGSINTSVEWQGFDLNFLFFARRGQTINDDQTLTYEGRNNWLDVDYWTPSNPTNAFPKPVSGRRAPVFGQTLNYQDGSFVRLRNVTLGYRLPAKVLTRIRASAFRVYVSALNPLLITNFRGIDPEGSTGITTPSVTTYMTGLNITF